MTVKITDSKIRSILKNKEVGRYAIGDGLYLRVTPSGSGLWVVRYLINDKRREISIGKYPTMGLASAKVEAAKLQLNIENQIDPLAEKQRQEVREFNTVNNLAEDWLEDCTKRLKYPHIPRRVYTKDIAPSIGALRIEQVNPRDIRAIINKIADSGRPTVSNDALLYCKQLFRHAIKLDLRNTNPAEAFNTNDAGGVEESRSRALSIEELQKVFQTFRENAAQFTRENYLACGLLVMLGIRKGELVAAMWDEIELEKGLWHIPKGRSKNGAAITVPLPEEALCWLRELKIRAYDSPYVFPNRRSSFRFGHISPDTLNAALQKLFKEGKMPVTHFTLHDLRRTCRSLLSSLGVQGHVAERVLNHKLKGVEGIYDRYDYLKERKSALNRIAKTLWKHIGDESLSVPTKK